MSAKLSFYRNSNLLVYKVDYSSKIEKQKIDNGLFYNAFGGFLRSTVKKKFFIFVFFFT